MEQPGLLLASHTPLESHRKLVLMRPSTTESVLDRKVVNTSRLQKSSERAIVALVAGNATQREKGEAAVVAIETQGYHLKEPVQRIWAGERDRETVTQGRDQEDER